MSCFKGGIDICYPPRPFRGEAVSNDGSNWIASIDSVDTFKNFIKVLNSVNVNFKDSEPHKRLIQLTKAIYHDLKRLNWDKSKKRYDSPTYVQRISEDNMKNVLNLGRRDKIKKPKKWISDTPIYIHQFRMIMQIFTPTFRKYVLKNSITFRTMNNLASNSELIEERSKLNYSKKHKGTTIRENKTSKELLRSYAELEKITTDHLNKVTHDKNTVNRQTDINKDQLDRIQIKNKFLRRMLLIFCIIILVLYSTDLGLPKTAGLIISFGMIIGLIAYSFLIWTTLTQRHALSYNQIVTSSHVVNLEDNNRLYQNAERCNADSSGSGGDGENSYSIDGCR